MANISLKYNSRPCYLRIINVCLYACGLKQKVHQTEWGAYEIYMRHRLGLTLKCDGNISYISNHISFTDIATRGFSNSDMRHMFDKSLHPIFTTVHIITERKKMLS